MTYMVSPKRISREIDKLFEGSLRGNGESQQYMPRVNIRETEDDVTMVFELPGMAKEDIKVTVENNVLTVSGQRQEAEADEKATYVRNEILGGTFSRSFTLPRTVDTGKIEADYSAGLLTIHMARKEEAKPKQIEVNVK
jgi:HSP20 family protein